MTHTFINERKPALLHELQGLEVVGCDPNMAMQPYARQSLLATVWNSLWAIIIGVGCEYEVWPTGNVSFMMEIIATWMVVVLAAVDAGLSGAVSLLQGSAEELPLESNSFDSAVITLLRPLKYYSGAAWHEQNRSHVSLYSQVLCSVRDPAHAIDEVIRVLKPQGRLLFLEHVAASWETQPLLRAKQVRQITTM
eukprot:1136988-Pelagomonas_calceolata.AAC.3